MIGLLTSTMLVGHADLDLQIENISLQILQAPANSDLYLKRGDLFRRHREWLKSRQDFEKVRELKPDEPQVDWYEGRLAVDAERWAEGDKLLSRFLESHEKHSSAYHTRAWARWQLTMPEASAQDYASAISYSERPAPALYRSLVITQYASGEEYRAEAAVTVDAGLQKFPGEPSLLGLGVDLALANAETDQASGYLGTLSPGLLRLPQWTFRKAVLSCLQGDVTSAVAGFESLMPGVGNRAGSWTLSPELIEALVVAPDPQTCRDTVLTTLGAQQP